MNIPDLINGLYESLGGFAICLHIKTLYKDKQVKGVNWFATAFFASWGFYNLYFYKHLDQTLSWYGGMFIVVANTVWLGMMLYYKKIKI